jgi:ribokinase
MPRHPPEPGSRPWDALVVGDANPDLVLRGDVVPRFGQAEQLLTGAALVPAGSAGIVASGLARLGAVTALAAHVGTDLFGDLMLARLAERGVDTSLITRHTDTPTGLSVILSAPDDRAILTLPGTIPLQRGETIDDDVLARVRHVHVASWFLIPELAAGAGELFRRAHQAGATTSLDTNWDPAERWHGVLDVLPEVDVFLPNAAELAAISQDDAESAGARIAASGTVVAVKAGVDGGVCWSAHGRVTAAPPPVDVLDTTGAGDSFDAGFLAGWLAGHPVTQCLRWAVTAGALSTRAAGGTHAQATAAELAAALEGLPPSP